MILNMRLPNGEPCPDHCIIIRLYICILLQKEHLRFAAKRWYDDIKSFQSDSHKCSSAFLRYDRMCIHLL